MPPGWRGLLALPALLAAIPAAATGTGAVEGRVRIAVEGASASEVGPLVVYLEPLGTAPEASPAAVPTPTIRQRDARFSPGFLVVSAGQQVAMPNDDRIYHNVFSYSKGNRFDLGLYPSGESRSATFDHPGLVKIYCSIHESMNASVYVAPTPHFTRVSASGRFALRQVPAGRYRLRTWCERLPETQLEIRVEAGRTLEVELEIAPRS